MAAARKAANPRHTGEEAYNYFLSVIFPDNQMQILDYNRVLKDLNDLSPAALLKKLDPIFTIQPFASNPTLHAPRSTLHASQPARKHDLGLYLAGQWHALQFRPAFTGARDCAETLDVSLLQKLVLAPIFGIDDPRTSKRVNFVRREKLALFSALSPKHELLPLLLCSG